MFVTDRIPGSIFFSVWSACLQMQYRGSEGFGKEFMHLGDKQWGADMQVSVF